MAAQRMPLLIVRARQALGWTQRQLAENLAGSHRTASRWESGRSTFHTTDAANLVRHVFPVDRDLAAEIAAHSGLSLIDLGLEAPPKPPPAPIVVAPAPAAPPLPPPPPRPAALRDLIEAIVCAVADEADVAPKLVRPNVLLTLRRAVEVGLDLKAAADAGLFGASGAVEPKTEPADAKKRAPSRQAPA